MEKAPRFRPVNSREERGAAVGEGVLSLWILGVVLARVGIPLTATTALVYGLFLTVF